MAASWKGHIEVVKSLVEAGANINHTNKVGIYATVITCTINCTHPPIMLHIIVHVIAIMMSSQSFNMNTYNCKVMHKHGQ